MTDVIMHDLTVDQVQVGDWIMGFECNGKWNDQTAQPWQVTKAEAWGVSGASANGLKALTAKSTRIRVKRSAHVVTTRPMVQGTVTLSPHNLPASKTVADWPLPCPRCGRANAAVMLFSSVDCKHGCFRQR